MNEQVKNPPVTFAEAFCKLQAEIRPAIKDSENEGFKRGGKPSRYADLAAVWEAVKKPLADNGFCVIQSPDFDTSDMFLKTTILHVSGEKMEGRYPLRPTKNDPQGYMAALTYARRGSLSSMLGVIADDDDDGNQASAPAPKPTQQAAPQREPEKDQDIEDGVKNWVAQQKGVIAECKTLPELTDWLDRNGGDLLKPALGSVLNRLMKKNNPAFIDLKNFYLDRMNKI